MKANCLLMMLTVNDDGLLLALLHLWPLSSGKSRVTKPVCRITESHMASSRHPGWRALWQLALHFHGPHFFWGDTSTLVCEHLVN